MGFTKKEEVKGGKHSHMKEAEHMKKHKKEEKKEHKPKK